MSYYIIPKTNNDVYLNPISSEDVISCDTALGLPYISHTLYHYYNEAMNELNLFFANNIDNNQVLSHTLEEFIKIINPYEYIFSIVPGSKFSVGKLKPNTNLFYDLLEIITNLNVLDSRLLDMQSLVITPNHADVIQCVELLRENSNDTTDCFNEIKDTFATSKKGTLYHFIFCEAYNSRQNVYIINLIHVIMVIFKRMASGGTCIIKIDCIFHKPVIDALYLLTSCFEKVYIIKPNTNNVTTFEKYIVCKHFLINENKRNVYNRNYDILANYLNRIDNKNILALINSSTPCHFINKLNDINTIIGQQQLEALHHILNILKSRNKEDKIDLLKKTHIQKSVIWCEKFKLPCNKFTEKTNIFLPIIKDDGEPNEEKDSFEPKFYIEDVLEIEAELNI
jgi:hypothetical protein